MERSRLEDLREIAAAKYLQEYRVIADLLAEEARLRRALAQLDRQVRSAHTTLADSVGAQRIGGDVLWQVWVGRTRRDLNLQLAKVMASKEPAMAGLQRSFGRRVALDRLIASEATGRRQMAARRFEQDLITFRS